MTKTQRRAKAARSRKKSRILKMGQALLRTVRGNPAKGVIGLRVKRLKGGGVSLVPVRGVKATHKHGRRK